VKKKLIAELDSTAGKTPWQTYTIRHGIEIIEVLVPLKNTMLFEVKMKDPMPSIYDVMRVLHECDGELKKD
jgi:hypothetical protein